MARRRSKEYSIEDHLGLFLSPILTAVSGYMYWVTRDDRHAFGPVIGEHVSNFFGTALAMYLATALTTAIEKNTEFASVKKLSFFMQVVCAIALVSINLHFEVWEGNDQMIGDLTSAIMALAVIWVNTRYSFDEMARDS
jgi:hypothetical protein